MAARSTSSTVASAPSWMFSIRCEQISIVIAMLDAKFNRGDEPLTGRDRALSDGRLRSHV
jgi:hypothetical protein